MKPVTIRTFNPARAALTAAVNRAIAGGAPIYENMPPRPTVSLAKPAPRRDRKRSAFDPAELLDLDFDQLDLCGSLSTFGR